MKEIIARCGARCDLCPAYKENINRFDKQTISDSWNCYYNFRIPSEELICK